MSPRLADASTLQLLNVADVAALLKVRRRKVYDLIRDDALPHMKVDRSYRFVIAELAQWLESRITTNPIPMATPAPALRSRDWSRRG
jgi:excisionase family DNA binding protein